MIARDLLAGVRPRLRRPYVVLAILIFALPFAIREVVVMRRLGQFWWPGVVFPFFVTTFYSLGAHWPWRWTGDERPRAPWLRGTLQSLLWCGAIMTALHLAYVAVIPVGSKYLPATRAEALRDGLLGGLLTTPIAAIIGFWIASGEITEEERETARREAKAAQARALQHQLSPHVLFNALNGLAELVRQDPVAAERGLLDLADLLRTILDHGGGHWAPLGEERHLVERFLAVEQMRLGERLKVEWAWDPALDPVLVPPLLVQPLVENAIKHGVAPRPEGGVIRILSQAAGPRLVLEVQNSGPGLRPSEGGGIGLQNLRARLDLAFPGQAHLELLSEGGWTRARLSLPRS